MFILIHGEDQVKTRLELQTRLNQARTAGIQDISALTDKSISLDGLIQSIESSSLFGLEHRLVVLENLHHLKSKAELKAILDYLAGLDPSSVSILMWENHQLTPGQIKSLPNAQVIEAKVSPAIFKLTDALVPAARADSVLDLLHTACTADSAEMVLIMLGRQLRLMIQVFDPKAKIPPWQRSKLQASARNFGLDRLIALHHELADIDYNNKTGKLSAGLQSELAFWLMKLYSKV